MHSPAADEDHAERETEELERLIKKFVLKGEDRREFSYGTQGTQLTDEYYILQILKVK